MLCQLCMLCVLCVLCGLSLLCIRCVPGSTALAGEPAGHVSVSSLSWLAGRWRGDSDSTWLEEHWSAPSGDCMMGMFRAVRAGHVRAYQFMSLEQDPEGVLLRVKRFDPGLVARDDHDRSVVFRLEHATWREAVFDYEGPESPKRLTYRRAGHDSLYVRLERVQGGEHGVMNFRFVRLAGE
jgi:hypothetical protein